MLVLLIQVVVMVVVRRTSDHHRHWVGNVEAERMRRRVCQCLAHVTEGISVVAGAVVVAVVILTKHCCCVGSGMRAGGDGGRNELGGM